MTVKELRDQLKDQPEDSQVVVALFGEVYDEFEVYPEEDLNQVVILL